MKELINLQVSAMEPHQTVGYFASDNEFDLLYPVHIRSMSEVHWTPLKVACTAARFLCEDKNAEILDIGAGVGKFCIAGSYYAKAISTGIEQRKNYVTIGNKLIKRLGVSSVTLMHGNFTEIDLCRYTGIYFFNSFHENLVMASEPDGIERSPELYAYYTSFLFMHLDTMPAGTRLATYWLAANEVPGSYKLQESVYDEQLKLWIKNG